MIKAQVLVGGRGKAGGVKLAASGTEAEAVAAEILALTIKDIPVRKVLVAAAADIVKEYYLGAILDRASRRILVIASAEGGVEIEEVARVTPEAIHRVEAHPLLGLLDWQARQLAFAIGLGGPHLRTFVAIARGLVSTMLAYDADLVEVNPLAVVRQPDDTSTATEALVCLDAKITLDDSGLARHPELEALRDPDSEDPADAEARALGIAFIHLDGSIGCMVNGAGLAMTTMDLVKRAGGEPANFLDIGGGARADKVAAAMRLILADPKVRAILVNIFGGITRGDEVARGLIEARAVQERDVPMVVRIVGTNAEEAGPPADGGPVRDRVEPRRRRSQGRGRGAIGRCGRRERGPGNGRVSILVGRETRLVVQGITGREGEFHSRQMLDYGTAVVAGVTPNKGGQTAVDGRVPVFDTVAEAVAQTGANTACIYVPAAGAPDAVLEAAGAGIPTIFCITEGVPALDMLKVVEVVRSAGARLIGPNCPGATSPGRAKVGIIPGPIHREGRVGVVSRSGTLTYEAVQAMTDAGIGQSTCVGIGGDPIVGTTFLDVLQLFAADAETEAIVLIGEIGGSAEEEAAAWAAEHLRGRADGGVHRRPDGARGQADGPRRRDHLRWFRDRRRQDRGARGRRASGSPTRRRRSRRSSAPRVSGRSRLSGRTHGARRRRRTDDPHRDLVR